MFTWVDGHLLLALMAIPIVSVWAIGFANHLLRVRAERQMRARVAERRRIFAARGGTR